LNELVLLHMIFHKPPDFQSTPKSGYLEIGAIFGDLGKEGRGFKKLQTLNRGLEGCGKRF